MEKQPDLVQYLIGLFVKADPSFHRIFQEKSPLLSRDELHQIMQALDADMQQLLAGLRQKEAISIAA